jgi:hypothetical protein
MRSRDTDELEDHSPFSHAEADHDFPTKAEQQYCQIHVAVSPTPLVAVIK